MRVKLPVQEARPAPHAAADARHAPEAGVGAAADRLAASPRATAQRQTLQRLFGAQPAPAAHRAAATTAPVQRMVMDDVRKALEKEPAYWDKYKHWFAIKGQAVVVNTLADIHWPFKTRKLKRLLDDFFANEKTDYSATELKRLGLERDFGASATFKALVKGIDLQAGAAVQLGQLLTNFKTLGGAGFDYTMDSTSAANFLNGAQGGDCNTVVRTFKLIAEDYLGLAAVYKTSGMVGFPMRFLAPQAVTIDGKTGNVDGGASWLFENHYWIEADGGPYDVLFGKTGIDTGAWVKEIGKSVNPSDFGATKIWTTGIVSPIAGRYLTRAP